MRVGVFLSPDRNFEHDRMLSAFAEGVKSLGHSVTLDRLSFHRTANTVQLDVAVVFGVHKKAVPVSNPRGAVIDAMHRVGKDVIIIEKGFVRRSEYYMVGLNGLNGRAEFHNINSNRCRWNELDVKMSPAMRHSGEHIVLIGQVPWDASVQHTDHLQWLVDTAYRLKDCGREVIFRPHPLAKTSYPYIMHTEESAADTLAEDLNEAWACVTFNSNSAVEALIAGVPVFTADEGSMCRTVSSWDLDMMSNPYRPDNNTRLQWAADLAYTQWNISEFEKGMPWLHLMSRGYSLGAA